MRRLPLLGLALFVACASGDDGSDDDGPRDAGDAPVCVPDTGGGIQVDCDPVAGLGCDVAKNQSCVWDIDADEGACGCLVTPLARGEDCSGGESCEAGHACLALSGDVARCHKVCDVPANSGCEVVTAANPTRAYTCAPLRTAAGGVTQDYGVCFGVGVACDPFMLSCPNGERCGLVGRATACVPEGARLLGEACAETDPCRGPNLCVPLVDTNGQTIPPKCYEPCRVDAPTCSAGQCVEVGLPVGLCF